MGKSKDMFRVPSGVTKEGSSLALDFEISAFAVGVTAKASFQEGGVFSLFFFRDGESEPFRKDEEALEDIDFSSSSFGYEISNEGFSGDGYLYLNIAEKEKLKYSIVVKVQKGEENDIGLFLDLYIYTEDDELEHIDTWGYETEEDILGEEKMNELYG